MQEDSVPDDPLDRPRVRGELILLLLHEDDLMPHRLDFRDVFLCAAEGAGNEQFHRYLTWFSCSVLLP